MIQQKLGGFTTRAVKKGSVVALQCQFGRGELKDYIHTGTCSFFRADTKNYPVV